MTLLRMLAVRLAVHEVIQDVDTSRHEGKEKECDQRANKHLRVYIRKRKNQRGKDEQVLGPLLGP
ncbi:hypothetical protein AMI01nite_49300 [Aneurinibacillus migulanus]|nr:hypothetical protein AMI01nite_49300 [Aneurinibacillus migulanus]